VSFILRRLRRAKWYKNENTPWLLAGELQADALGDLLTQFNALSIWQIEADRTNLERVIAALVTTQENLSNFDYVLVDQSVIENAGFKIESNIGETPDSTANTWHRDLIELTADRLLMLARIIRQEGEIERLPEKRVIQLVNQSLSRDYIHQNQLSEKLLRKLMI
jgi:hypothetical protein